MEAAAFANSRKRKRCSDITVSEAIDGYINAKTNVLSPSTIRAYRNMQNKYYGSIGSIKIKRITSEDAQLFISDLAAKYSAKTTKNAYALFCASMAFYEPDNRLKVTLPTTIKKTAAAPSSASVMGMYELASPWMKQCIALAAFGGIRRGEIASLKYGDIKGNTIFIHSDMVMDVNNKWVYKEIPKNQASVRWVKLPQQVIDMLGTGGPDEFIIKYNPNTISKMYIKLRNRAGVDVRFHDLRHYYSSIGALLHVPDNILADFAGWRHDSPTMKNTYQGSIKDIAEEYSEKMTTYFDGLLNKV